MRSVTIRFDRVTEASEAEGALADTGWIGLDGLEHSGRDGSEHSGRHMLPLRAAVAFMLRAGVGHVDVSETGAIELTAYREERDGLEGETGYVMAMRGTSLGTALRLARIFTARNAPLYFPGQPEECEDNACAGCIWCDSRPDGE